MTTPTINVNLTTCHCGPDLHCRHDNAPVLIPCPISRSVTLQVVLGACSMRCVPVHTRDGSHGVVHALDCPARPVKVSCSISSPDGSWEKSDVTEVERHWQDPPTWGRGEKTQALGACRARWALVKALALGQRPLLCLTERDPAYALADQRDAVYAAIADMARLEDGLFAAQARLDRAASARGFSDVTGVSSDPADRPSADFLAAYLEHLIEQVGVLVVAP